MSVTTTKNSPFRNVIDITHRPERTQHDNIMASGRATVQTAKQELNYVPASDVPMHNVSLERAIAYYEAHQDDGEYSTLYRNTVKWLRELLAVDRYEVRRAMESEDEASKAAQEEEDTL